MHFYSNVESSGFHSWPCVAFLIDRLGLWLIQRCLILLNYIQLITVWLPVYKDISFLVETCFFLSFLFIYISYYFLNYNFMCCAIIQMLNQLVFVHVPCVVVCFCLVHRHGIQLITHCIAHTFVSGWTSVGSLPDYSDSGLISFSFLIFLFAFHWFYIFYLRTFLDTHPFKLWSYFTSRT